MFRIGSFFQKWENIRLLCGNRCSDGRSCHKQENIRSFLGHNPSDGKFFHMEETGSPGRSFHNWGELEIWKSFPYMETVARPPSVRRAVFQFLPAMPIFVNGNHFHMNCQKIPIIQLSDNSEYSQLPISGSRGEFSELSDNSKNSKQF